MPKLIKLYYIISTNASWIFLLVIILSFGSLAFGQAITNNQLRNIVIDAGHGGKDPGTMGTKRYNTYEKDIALSVSLMLGEYISDAFPSINVIYTRKKDIFLELNERTAIANSSNADLFISIHCDGFTNSTASGASVFVMGMSKLKANLDVAMRENSAIYLEDNYKQKYDGFDPQSIESYIVFNLMQNTHLGQSLKLAEHVDQQFANKANRKSRGVKQAPFYVISRTNMPSILIECGFLTNPDEEDFLQSDLGKDYIASAIFRAFRSYKQSVESTDNIREVLGQKDSIMNTTLLKEISKEPLEEVVYKVQIGTYLKSMLADGLFINLEVDEELSDGVFKYYVGSENKKSNADKIKDRMLDLGFKGAFVVDFYKDSRISIKEALALQVEIKTYE